MFFLSLFRSRELSLFSDLGFLLLFFSFVVASSAPSNSRPPTASTTTRPRKPKRVPLVGQAPEARDPARPRARSGSSARIGSRAMCPSIRSTSNSVATRYGPPSWASVQGGPAARSRSSLFQQYEYVLNRRPREGGGVWRRRRRRLVASAGHRAGHAMIDAPSRICQSPFRTLFLPFTHLATSRLCSPGSGHDGSAGRLEFVAVVLSLGGGSSVTTVTESTCDWTS